MNPTSTISTSTLDATPRNRSALQVAAIGALAATVANVALWVGGRAADVRFLVSPLAGAPTMQVGVVAVVLTSFSRSSSAGRSSRWPVGVPADGCAS
jgi:hypothetical protein